MGLWAVFLRGLSRSFVRVTRSWTLFAAGGRARGARTLRRISVCASAMEVCSRNTVVSALDMEAVDMLVWAPGGTGIKLDWVECCST